MTCGSDIMADSDGHKPSSASAAACRRKLKHLNPSAEFRTSIVVSKTLQRDALLDLL